MGYTINKWTCLFLCTDEDILIFQKIYIYKNVILYLITPRLDNLLLKTFGVAVKVPNFSFCCLMYLFFQMWFQLQTCCPGFLWLSSDTFFFSLGVIRRPKWRCAIVCVQQSSLVGWWITVQSKSVHVTLSSDFVCIACSNLGPNLGSSHGALSQFNMEVFTSHIT